MQNYSSKKAFSLIELSIALVIIGLIIGGILVGQDLLNGAKKRALISEHEKIVTAATTFKLKYNALPGDISNPTSYFGNVFSGATGNGNGIILWGDEGTLAWRQMYLAGLVEQDINTTSFGCCYIARFGSDSTIPESKAYKGGGWALGVRTGENKNTAFFGKPQTHILPILGIVMDIDTLNIDEKMDDGKASTGKVRVSNSECNNSGEYTTTGGTLCAFEAALGL